MGQPSDEQYDPTLMNPTPPHVERQTPTIRLFKNDYTPTPASLIADFTEADFTGYDPVSATGTLFESVADDRFERQHGVAVFAHTGVGAAQTIYGWYATGTVNDPASGAQLGSKNEVMACERFAMPIVLEDAGDSIRIHYHEHQVGVAD